MPITLSAKTKPRRRVPVLPGPLYLMRLTVPAASITALRQVATRVCGDALQFMRVDTCNQMCTAKVSLCVTQGVADVLIGAITHYLPDANFGTLSVAGPRDREVREDGAEGRGQGRRS